MSPDEVKDFLTRDEAKKLRLRMVMRTLEDVCDAGITVVILSDGRFASLYPAMPDF
jgi:hypothetical protein